MQGVTLMQGKHGENACGALDSGATQLLERTSNVSVFLGSESCSKKSLSQKGPNILKLDKLAVL